MKIVVIGAVAAGTSAAAKARRNDDFADITIYDKDQHISYSGCGLPYYIGGKIKDIKEITPRDAQFFKKKYNIDVKTEHEVIQVNRKEKTLKIKNLRTEEIIEDYYDKLIIATGATAVIPPIKGKEDEYVFSLRNVQDAIRIHEYIEEKKPKTAVIVGSGFIGLEVLENLMGLGIHTTVVEKMSNIIPILDVDMAKYLENELLKKEVTIKKNSEVVAIEKKKVRLSSEEIIDADMVILATGVRPNTKIAEEIGLEIGDFQGIIVDKTMKTNDEDIYACGDCIETYEVLTNTSTYRPLGSTANKTGRIAGENITGGHMEYRGNLGTGIFKVFDIQVATTGLLEKQAKKAGYDIEIIHNIKPDRPLYYQGENMIIKAIADRISKRILGVQIIGKHGVDKRVDVFATLLTYGATVDELFHLDLAYAPPFSTTKDPVHYTGMILDNAINKKKKIITATEIKEEKKLQIIDTRTKEDCEKKGCVDGAIHIPHAELREKLHTLDKDRKTVTYCNKGVTGNAAQNILIHHGFKDVYNLSGGHTFYKESK